MSAQRAVDPMQCVVSAWMWNDTNHPASDVRQPALASTQATSNAEAGGGRSGRHLRPSPSEYWWCSPNTQDEPTEPSSTAL